jgi:hypothetical protein
MNESILLSMKGLYLILASGALHVVALIAQAADAIEPTAIIRSLETLGPQGLLLAGIVYLYKANQKLEIEIKAMHEEQKKANDAHLKMMQEQIEKSDESRDRLYNAIRGALSKNQTPTDQD